MLIKLTKLAAVMLLVGVFALVVLRSSPVSAALAPAGPLNSPSNSLNSNSAVTTTVTVTPTTAVTPTVGSTPTSSTARVTPTSVPPTATATKAASTATITPTVAVATATKTVAPATATKTVTPTVVTATVTKTATPVPPTATKTATPASRLAPRASSIPASLSTLFFVQNLDPLAVATVTAQFYNSSGNIVNLLSPTLAPSKMTVIDQRNTGGGLDATCSPACPSPWNGSVVLSSNTQIASIVEEVSASTALLGGDFRSDAYNGIGATSASQKVILPQVLKGAYDGSTQRFYNSTIAIQNTSLGNPATVSVTYYHVDHSQYVHSNISIPAGSSVQLDMTTETTTPALPALFNGGAVVTANQPIGVVVNQNAPGALMTYTGFADTEASTKIYVPALMKNQWDGQQNKLWGTLLLVMAADPTLTNVPIYVTYSNADGWTKTQVVNANPNLLLDQRSDPFITPPVLSASAIVTSSVPIVAIVNEVTNAEPTRGVRELIYRGFPNGSNITSKVFFPFLIRSQPDAGTGATWHTAILGQLIGTTPARVFLNYTNIDGQTAQSYVDVNPSLTTKFIIDQGSQSPSTIQPALYASGVMTSTQPLVGIVMQVGNASDLGDTSMGYQGINQ